jgi:hypothetical protein
MHHTNCIEGHDGITKVVSFLDLVNRGYSIAVDLDEGDMTVTVLLIEADTIVHT